VLDIDQKQCRLRVVDPDHGAAVGRNGDAGERARGLDLAEQFSLRQVDYRNRGVFFVLYIESRALRRDDQPVAVGRAGIDGVHHLVGRRIDHRHDRAVLAGDVDEPVGPELERVRRDIGAQIDGGRMGALVEIEHAEQMLRVGIAAVNASPKIGT
jgi:hypothetical protein